MNDRYYINDVESSRLDPDRRKCPTPILSRFTIMGGKRKTIRREKDKKKHLFVDLYSTRLMIAVLLLFCLSCLDAFLTLALINKGIVYEANPVMAYFLGYGILPFAFTKFAITASAIAVLCLFKNVNLTRISMPLAIKLYVAVIIYEFYLIMI
jgi:hypothetical protein